VTRVRAHAASAESCRTDARWGASTASRTRIDDVLGGDALGQRVVGERDAVAQDVGREVADVVRDDVPAAAQEREGLGGLDHPDRPARRGAEGDVLAQVLHAVALGVARGVGEGDGVGDHRAVHVDLARLGAVADEVVGLQRCWTGAGGVIARSTTAASSPTLG
jgi:hypothetical protein